MDRSEPDILLTAVAVAHYGSRIRDAAPAATWTVMDTDGTITRGGHPIDREDADPEVAWINAEIFDADRSLVRPYFGLLLRCRSLTWVQSSAAGFEHPVFRSIADQGATLTNAHVGGPNIAEYVLGQVLAHRLDLAAWRDAQRRKAWEKHEFREIHGTTWLVVGVGEIGGAVAERARAFGCRVVGVRRNPTGDEPVDEMIGPDAVLDAVGEADVVVLALPGGDDNRHLVDGAFLARMKEDAILVNVARGSLVDEAALLASLLDGRPELAVLDVTETEPLPPESALWDHPRVVITPHSAGAGDGHFERGADVFVDNLARFVAGRPLRNVVTF